jgi:tight adherence protein C
MNYRRGGELFVMSLRSLNRDLWEKRKAMTRILGEEASSKLIFPMLLILLAVMIIVAAPAVMLMD